MTESNTASVEATTPSNNSTSLAVVPRSTPVTAESSGSTLGWIFLAVGVVAFLSFAIFSSNSSTTTNSTVETTSQIPNSVVLEEKALPANTATPVEPTLSAPASN